MEVWFEVCYCGLLKRALLHLCMAKKLLQVPFIAFYRKEYVEPELNINDLWKVYQWDEKVGDLCFGF